MWKWFRSWFAWRFSLARLVVAVVFLGAVVGLNCRKIGPTYLTDLPACYFGWPLPLAEEAGSYERSYRIFEDYYIAWANRSPDCEALEKKWYAYSDAARHPLPLTHQAYRILSRKQRSEIRWWLTIYGLIDVVLCITPTVLILILQMPRRKVAAKVK
jgi:hypothetical protein